MGTRSPNAGAWAFNVMCLLTADHATFDHVCREVRKLFWHAGFARFHTAMWGDGAVLEASLSRPQP